MSPAFFEDVVAPCGHVAAPAAAGATQSSGGAKLNARVAFSKLAEPDIVTFERSSPAFWFAWPSNEVVPTSVGGYVDSPWRGPLYASAAALPAGVHTWDCCVGACGTGAAAAGIAQLLGLMCCIKEEGQLG